MGKSVASGLSTDTTEATASATAAAKFTTPPVPTVAKSSVPTLTPVTPWAEVRFS